jgi:hypothetical protein
LGSISFIKKATFTDVKMQDGIAADEKWFVYGPDKKPEIDLYISSR